MPCSLYQKRVRFGQVKIGTVHHLSALCWLGLYCDQLKHLMNFRMRSSVI